MAYWWVSQGQTFQHESKGGYLWAPGPDSANLYHWAAMDLVRPGDVFVSYVDQSIGAVITAQSSAELVERPAPYVVEGWKGLGRRINASYVLVNKPIPINSLDHQTLESLAHFHGPLNKNFTGNQGYLFSISDAAAHAILSLIDQAVDPNILDAAIANSAPTETERRALLKARIGQGIFRDRLLAYWGGSCAVSGLSLSRLLRASHIKPWRDSDNNERIDVYNGLLLSPAYDAAFDAGLVSFSDSGGIIISAALDHDTLTSLAIDPKGKLTKVEGPHLGYLKHHREASQL